MLSQLYCESPGQLHIMLCGQDLENSAIQAPCRRTDRPIGLARACVRPKNDVLGFKHQLEKVHSSSPA